MTRLFVLLAALVLLAAAAAGAAAGEHADTAAVAVAAETQEKSAGSSNATADRLSSFWAYWLEGGNALRSEVVRNLGLLAVAIIGVCFGIWRAMTAYKQARASERQAHTAEQGLITERFSRAVEQLDHDGVTVRIGGLYALKRIAEDSVERDHLAVMDVITNFVRQPPYTTQQRESAERGRELRPHKIISRSGSAGGAAVAPAQPEREII